ncbi:MAG: hypothetical protein ACRDGA_07010 [Bacteroidota bacterium]
MDAPASAARSYSDSSKQGNPDSGIFCGAAQPVVVLGGNAHEMLKLLGRWRW